MVPVSEDCRSIERPLEDAFDDEYALAGRLLGTKWDFPDGTTQKVVRVYQGDNRDQGVKMTFPKLRFDQGKELRVSSFGKKVRRDTEPTGTLAQEIAVFAGWKDGE